MNQAKFIQAGIWEPIINKPVRISFTYKEFIRPFIWVVVKKDGSILLGRSPSGNELFPKIGMAVSNDGSATIKYDEGVEVQEPDALKKAKVSFHASGVVRANIPAEGLRSFNKSLRDMSEPMHLCSIVFQHPSQYKSIETIRKQDIVLNYPFDEKFPLSCDVYATPLGHQPLPLIHDAKEQVPVILWYRNLDNMPDLEVRFYFYHNAGGLWSPYTYIVWINYQKND